MAIKRKKLVIWSLIILIIGLIAAVAIRAKNKPKGVEVETEIIGTTTIKETVSASGKIYPSTEVSISSDVSGEIVELYVNEGDSVVTGQILAKIDPDTYISAVERGKASVNSSKAQLSMSNSQIETARAQMEQVKAQLENARNIHKRNDQLKKEGVVSQIEFEQSLANLRGLEANLRASEASLKAAQQSAQGQQFAIKSSEANLKELSTSLSRTTIKAPMSGIISSLTVEKGERVVGTIQMTGTPMMRISNLNSMEVQVDVSENDIPKLKMGDDVDIDVDAYLNTIFKGTVSEIANSAKNIALTTSTDQVTNFVVKIKIDPASYNSLATKLNKYPLRPGMSASVDIYTNQVEDIVAAPISAVTVREKKSAVKEEKKILEDSDFEEVVFLMAGDTAKQVVVKTGIQNDQFIHILSGLKKGDVVISGPYNTVAKELKSGEKVRIKVKEKNDKKSDKK